MVGRQRRNGLIVGKEIGDLGGRGIPAVSASKAHRGKSGFDHGGRYARVIEVGDDSIAFPCPQVRQSLVLERVLLNIDVPIARLVDVVCDPCHHLGVVG